MRKYSFIFGKLVRNDTDLVGLLAYSIYKRQKIDHIQRFADREHREPTEDELDSFHQFTNSESQLQQYYSTAENDLNALINDLMSGKAEQIEQFYRGAFKGVAKENKQGFWYGVGQGVVSSVLYTLLLGVIFIISYSLQLGPIEVIEKVFHVQITRDEAPAPAPKKQ